MQGSRMWKVGSQALKVFKVLEAAPGVHRMPRGRRSRSRAWGCGGRTRRRVQREEHVPRVQQHCGAQERKHCVGEAEQGPAESINEAAISGMGLGS